MAALRHTPRPRGILHGVRKIARTPGWCRPLAGALLCAAMLALPVSLAALLGRYAASPASTDAMHVVYLTFDDGPSAVTDKVLDILREEGVQASFFVIGATTEHGVEVYRRILGEGHSLAMHTYSHDVNKIYASLSGYTQDFLQLERWISENTGTSPRVCRMVGGSNSAFCPAVLREQILTYLVETGYSCFDWDIDSRDSLGYTVSARQIARNVIQAAREMPEQDLIVLLHDDSLRTTLPDALRDIIAYFKERGYRFETLKEDTESAKKILPRKYQG